MLFRKRKQEEKRGGNEPPTLGYEHFKRYVYILLSRLVMAYQTMPLTWWQALMTLIAGFFLGIGIGAIVNQFLPQEPRVIMIRVNETHIIRVVPGDGS